ncbi:MAG: branched-chain amino acid transport system II carrier protein [Clostridiaceae bacterium]|nr:branched-chain amino acid transport system II carrier protein [Clostridiaceae bacterium]
MDKKVSMSDTVVVGFAMFAVFFGAGNLIFPPYLGMLSGKSWFLGFLCFVIADAGLAMMTVLAMIRGNGTIFSVVGRLGKKTSVLLATVSIICVGPLLCIPRTCATTYEMGMLPIVPGFNSWAFAFVFFALVFFLTIRPTAVVDVIGKFLTPALLLTLAILFIKGILSPIGEIAPVSADVNVAKEGFMAGYQTMDVLGALAITLVIVGDVAKKGYISKKSSFKVISYSSIIATIGLFLSYCGLAYLGATASTLDLGDINQAGLVVKVTELLLNKFGVVLLALIVLFACLTTAVGLVSSASEYFSDLSKGKISYGKLVTFMCLSGMVISNVGITAIINLATPILNVIYPVLLTQICLSFFNDKIKNDNVFKWSAMGALIVCIIGVAGDFGAPVSFVDKLPFASLGLEWILPAIAGGVIGAFIPSKKEPPAVQKMVA